MHRARLLLPRSEGRLFWLSMNPIQIAEPDLSASEGGSLIAHVHGCGCRATHCQGTSCEETTQTVSRDPAKKALWKSTWPSLLLPRFFQNCRSLSMRCALWCGQACDVTTACPKGYRIQDQLMDYKVHVLFVRSVQ